MHPNFSATVWRRGSGTPQVEPGCVDVWTADLDSGIPSLSRYERLLSDRERQRVDRLQVDLVARRYVVSRGILRLLLSRYTGQPVDSLRFQFGPLGKPSLKPLDDGRVLSFNNTDSAGMAIYAFAWNRELGVDLERLPREVRAERISRRRFAAAEADAIANTPVDQRDTAFIACWTRKEAWGKAIGLGIRYPMSEIDLCSKLHCPVMQIDSQEALATGGSPDAGPWRLVQLRPQENAIAAVVASGLRWQVRGWRYNHELLNTITDLP